MFATLITISLFAGSLGLLISMFRNNGDKIVAALEGQSWTAQPPVVRFRSMTVRLESAGGRTMSVRTPTEWRAAA